MLREFLRSVFAWQKKRGRELGIREGQTGAVTFQQRFGGALNLNPHFHSLIPDGLFVLPPPTAPTDGAPCDRLTFAALPPPTSAEVEKLTLWIARLCSARLPAAIEEEGQGFIDPDLAALFDVLFSAQNPPPGIRDLPFLSGLGADPEPGGADADRGESGRGEKALCASVAGFSLHAAQAVPAFDREALERLLRYGLRAPFSQQRLSRRGAPAIPASVPKAARRRLPWAQLLRRVLSVDALSCPRCSTRTESVPMTVLAFITDVIKRILRHLHLPPSPPLLARARTAGTPRAFPLEDGELFARERVGWTAEAEGAQDGGARRREDDGLTGLGDEVCGAERDGPEEAG